MWIPTLRENISFLHQFETPASLIFQRVVSRVSLYLFFLCSVICVFFSFFSLFCVLFAFFLLCVYFCSYFKPVFSYIPFFVELLLGSLFLSCDFWQFFSWVFWFHILPGRRL
eukprot:TRINITY_DN6120_c0_g1::TRINITY_DN6120_c0_g1_i1::g.22682::m.22682 TRINITY_DN6120_c0_g1::TRINITY_DN6120_c0_g1_i1::g.22682  ORF type:complete len:112 (-),score=-23.72,DUF1700/PF08006.6/0.77 TRINITY_DN6120_c0_g1_i1:61-396(-)